MMMMMDDHHHDFDHNPETNVLARPTASHLTNLCLFDVQDTWNILNLADTIADLENIRRLPVTFECNKTTHLRFSKKYEMASKIFKDTLSSLQTWPKQHLRQSTLTLTDWQTTTTGLLSLWPFRAGPWHLREYCMGQSKILAFASCQHRRLGAQSLVKILSENLVKVIANIFTGASNKTLEWSSRDQREQLDIESTDITIRTYMRSTYKMPASLRNSTIKRLKHCILNNLGSTTGWIVTTDRELDVYHEQNTLAGTPGAEPENLEPLGDYIRLHTLTGFPKYTLFVSTTMRASAGVNQSSELHLDDDPNDQVTTHTDENKISPTQDEAICKSHYSPTTLTAAYSYTST
jgi:hypothetical protein